jgi:hypothetical protein
LTSIACELESHSQQTHLEQIYTGFSLLHRSGRVRVRQRVVRKHETRTRPQHLRDAHNYQLRVVVNGRVAINYDTHDSWEIDESVLPHVDLYFKRSYAPERVAALEAGARTKIRPLGLNYAVFPDRIDRFGFARSLRLGRGMERIRSAARCLAVTDRFAFTPRVRAMSAPPDFDTPPKVLFMVRTFDPNDHAERAPEKIAERRTLNDARADLIRALRREWGSRFYGGFVHTPHAIARYPDLLVPEPARGTKGGYIAQLRAFPIGVATTGIHGSTGWKFAEYIAFSKAIVTEPLVYRATGDLAPERNYLEFTSVDACLAAVARLFDDEALRHGMMANNARYYESDMRPERLVMNTLEAALSL